MHENALLQNHWVKSTTANGQGAALTNSSSALSEGQGRFPSSKKYMSVCIHVPFVLVFHVACHGHGHILSQIFINSDQLVFGSLHSFETPATLRIHRSQGRKGLLKQRVLDSVKNKP